jgi:hypothetical protein
VNRRLVAGFCRLLGIGALVVVATACRLDISTTVDVARNGSGRITVVAVADAELVERAPELKNGIAADDLRARGWTVGTPTPLPDGGIQVIVERVFATPAEATALLAGLSGEAGPFHDLTLTRTGSIAASTFDMTGELRVDGGLGAFADADIVELVGAVPFDDILTTQERTLSDTLSLSLATRLPGDVSSTSGAVDENVVRWDVPLDGSSVAVEARSRNFDVAALLGRIIAIVAVVALAAWLIGMAVVTVRIVRRRRAIGRTP